MLEDPSHTPVAAPFLKHDAPLFPAVVPGEENASTLQEGMAAAREVLGVVFPAKERVQHQCLTLTLLT